MAGVPGSSHGLNVSGYVLRQVTVITGNQTYTVPTSVVALWVEAVGGGGAGGGTPATNAAGNGQSAAGGGGGGGAYAAAWLASLSASYTVTIGAGGVAVSGAGGGNGGNTSFGSVVIAEGGQGAPVAVRDVGVFPDTSGAPARGGLGSNSTGDLKVDGGSGFGGWLARVAYPWGGGGGESGWGGGGNRLSGPSDGTFAGNPGRQYGGGGQGACAITNQAAQIGGNGAAGVVIVHEYMQT